MCAIAPTCVLPKEQPTLAGSHTPDSVSVPIEMRQGQQGATASVPVGAPAAPQQQQQPFVDTAELPMNLLKMLIVIFMGACQGVLLGLVGMFNPAAFRSQMRFDTWILLKLFLSGIGSSMITQSFVFDSFMPARWNVVRAHRRLSMGYSRVMFGSALVGFGMTLAGSGPTMIGVQLGVGTWSAPYIFCGFLIGAAIFQILEPFFKFPAAPWKGEGEKTVMEDFLNGEPTVNHEGKLTASGERGTTESGRRHFRYRDLALPFGACMLGLAIGLEWALPHHDDLRFISLGAFAVKGSPMYYIYPSMAGGFIGLNQLTTRYIMGDGQGGSRSLVMILGTATGGIIAPRFKVDSFAKGWQFVHVYMGTVLGGVIALLIMNRYNRDEHVLPPGHNFATVTDDLGFNTFHSIFGAIFVGFGARWAGGCTCGHGVSGASELNIQSMAAAATIFASGIATAFAFRLRV